MCILHSLFIFIFWGFYELIDSFNSLLRRIGTFFLDLYSFFRFSFSCFFFQIFFSFEVRFLFESRFFWRWLITGDSTTIFFIFFFIFTLDFFTKINCWILKGLYSLEWLWSARLVHIILIESIRLVLLKPCL